MLSTDKQNIDYDNDYPRNSEHNLRESVELWPTY